MVVPSASLQPWSFTSELTTIQKCMSNISHFLDIVFYRYKQALDLIETLGLKQLLCLLNYTSQ